MKINSYARIAILPILLLAVGCSNMETSSLQESILKQYTIHILLILVIQVILQKSWMTDC